MESLGRWLRTARGAKALTLEEIEAITCIRVRFLEALESGDYGAMPSGEAQTRGFLRRYAAFLGLSPEEAIARYEQEAATTEPIPTTATVTVAASHTDLCRLPR